VTAEESEGGEKKGSRLNRRTFVKGCVGAAAAGLLGANVITAFDAFKPPSRGEKEAFSDVFTYYVSKEEEEEGKLPYVDKKGEEVKAEDLKMGEGASVLWRGLPVILIRLDPSKLNVEVGTEDGFIAFLGKCTHLCCVPNWHKAKPELNLIFCPCHAGQYDPFDVYEQEFVNESGETVKYMGPRVLSGPPPRGIPLVPLKIVDGKVTGLPLHPEWYNYCGVDV